MKKIFLCPKFSRSWNETGRKPANVNEDAKIESQSDSCILGKKRLFKGAPCLYLTYFITYLDSLFRFLRSSIPSSTMSLITEGIFWGLGPSNWAIFRRAFSLWETAHVPKDPQWNWYLYGPFVTNLAVSSWPAKENYHCEKGFFWSLLFQNFFINKRYPTAKSSYPGIKDVRGKSTELIGI